MGAGPVLTKGPLHYAYYRSLRGLTQARSLVCTSKCCTRFERSNFDPPSCLAGWQRCVVERFAHDNAGCWYPQPGVAAFTSSGKLGCLPAAHLHGE
eukprot:scaffold35488_cov35-Prasinocladus_malaysianus.AAC.1